MRQQCTGKYGSKRAFLLLGWDTDFHGLDTDFNEFF
jgi:hypothetical protein